MPEDKLKAFWTVVIMILMLYTAIFVPFQIAFIDEETSFLKSLENAINILFGIDIFMVFISAVEHP
jgi:hypothetical protein